MDILIAIDDNNLNNLGRALKEFGVPNVDKNLFKEKGNVFRIGRSPIRIELINDVSGIQIDDCYKRRKVILVDGMEISLISREDLIINKKAAGRAKDIADVENLEGIA